MESTAKTSKRSISGVTIVEPGGARTQFRYGSLKLAEPMEAYDDRPASLTRGARDTSRPPIGDPVKMATVIIDSVDQSLAPKRIALGSDSCTYMHNALTERLVDLEAQKDLAFSMDCSAAV